MVMLHHEDLSLHYIYLTSRTQFKDQHSRPLIICIHGLFIGNLASWYGIGVQLSQHHDVLMYDLRGHGRSSTPIKEYQLTTMIQDLNRLISHVDGSQRRVILMGHSYGALLALQWSLHYPQRMMGLVLLDIPLHMDQVQSYWMIGQLSTVESTQQEELQTLWESLPFTVQKILEQSPRRAKKLLTRWWTLGTKSSLLKDLAAEKTEFTKDLKYISCPVMSIFGQDSDCYATQSILREKLIHGTHVELPNTGHFILNEAPQQVLSYIQSFMSTLEIDYA